MAATRHLIWIYLALFGAAAPIFNVLIWLFDRPPSFDPLIANMCNDLSFASVTLGITSIVSAVHDFGTGKPTDNTWRLDHSMKKLLGIISTLLLNMVLYVKITSKTLAVEVIGGSYLVSIVALFLVTLVLSYSVMLTFEGQGGSQ